MLAFPAMLIPAARNAGMKTPHDVEYDEHDELVFFDEASKRYGKKDFPHFFVYCILQLARPLTDWNEPHENAVVIANIPADRLMTMTAAEFTAAGVRGIQ